YTDETFFSNIFNYFKLLSFSVEQFLDRLLLPDAKKLFSPVVKGIEISLQNKGGKELYIKKSDDVNNSQLYWDYNKKEETVFLYESDIFLQTIIREIETGLYFSFLNDLIAYNTRVWEIIDIYKMHRHVLDFRNDYNIDKFETEANKKFLYHKGLSKNLKDKKIENYIINSLIEQEMQKQDLTQLHIKEQRYFNIRNNLDKLMSIKGVNLKDAKMVRTIISDINNEVKKMLEIKEFDIIKYWDEILSPVLKKKLRVYCKIESKTYKIYLGENTNLEDIFSEHVLHDKWLKNNKIIFYGRILNKQEKEYLKRVNIPEKSIEQSKVKDFAYSVQITTHLIGGIEYEQVYGKKIRDINITKTPNIDIRLFPLILKIENNNLVKVFAKLQEYVKKGNYLRAIIGDIINYDFEGLAEFLRDLSIFYKEKITDLKLIKMQDMIQCRHTYCSA
ncbi:hypothetical protein ACFL4O_04095, partial [bacterium]